jgi:hypothetical protein
MTNFSATFNVGLPIRKCVGEGLKCLLDDFKDRPFSKQ